MPSAWQRLASFNHEDQFRRAAIRTDAIRPQLQVATPVKLEAVGETDLFAPINDDLPAATIAPEGEQEPVATMQIEKEIASVSIMVSSRGRTRTVSFQMRESMAQGLTSPSILGCEAVVKQQLDENFPFALSHNSFLQEEENMTQPVAYASKDISNIMFYHEAINQPDAIKFAKAIIKEINGHVDNGDWECVPRHTAPEGVTPVSLLWSM